MRLCDRGRGDVVEVARETEYGSERVCVRERDRERERKERKRKGEIVRACVCVHARKCA